MVVCYYGDSLEICLWRERKREQSLQGWIIDDVVKQIQWYSSSSFIQYFTSQVIAFYGRRARGPLLIPQLSLFEKPQIWRKKKVLCITRGNAAAATGNREADDLLLDEALCGFITHPLICTKDFATSNLWISSKAHSELALLLLLLLLCQEGFLNFLKALNLQQFLRFSPS